MTRTEFKQTFGFGAIGRLADLANLSRPTVDAYFSGKRISYRARERINRAMIELNAEVVGDGKPTQAALLK